MLTTIGSFSKSTNLLKKWNILFLMKKIYIFASSHRSSIPTHVRFCLLQFFYEISGFFKTSPLKLLLASSSLRML